VKDLDDLVLFRAVLEEGSFTAAAKTLHVSKSWVSKRIKALEQRLGTPLLVRNTRGLRPTETGQAYFQRISQALDLVEEAELLVQREAGEVRGTLRVSLPGSFGVTYVAKHLAAFAVQHPALRVDASYTDRKVDLIEEGFDLAIRVGPLPEADVVARRIGRTEGWVVGAPDYLAQAPPLHTPEDLRHHRALMFSLSKHPDRWTFEGHPPVRVDGPLRVDQGDAMVIAAEAGLGLALVPSWMARDAVTHGRLLRVLPDFPIQRSGIWALYPHHRHLIPRVTQFVDRLTDAFREMFGEA